MTWKTFAPLCHTAAYITPDDWERAFRQVRPDFLFCESAWTGITERPNVWRGRIFRNHSVCFEHRRELLHILEYCRAEGITTVFWNKEDPVYFDQKQCDFADTAVRFDYIFTTAQECIPRYQARGHENVRLMPFGFSPQIFHPWGRTSEVNGAVYTGSWFSEHPQRCIDLDAMLTWLETQHIPLTIYDRQMRSGDVSSFPQKQHVQICPAVPYESLGMIYRQYAYGVNINTVKDSETMYARRVLEMMACALPVVSNESLGMERRFGDKVGILKEGHCIIPKEDSVHELVREVFVSDTVARRLDCLLKDIGFPAARKYPSLAVFCLGRQAEKLFEHIQWPIKQRIPVQDKEHLSKALAECRCDYVIILDDDSQMPDIPFWMTQFDFLPDDCGVGEGEARYEIHKAKDVVNIIWPNFCINKREKYHRNFYCA